MPKVLVVLDAIGRLKDAGGGLLASGNWWRPGRDHDVIRVHAMKGGPSTAGGTIVGTERNAEGRTVVIFRPDPGQVGRPYPDGGVRQNGRLTLLE